MNGTPMNGIDELRASLAAHAESVTDAAAVARSASLQARIRHARNQRRGAMAGGLAAAVLAAGGLYAAISSPDTRHSSTPEIAGQIAGHVLEKDVTVGGFHYRLAATEQSEPGQRTFSVRLPKAESGRVVELVGTGLGKGSATLRDGDLDLARVSDASSLAVPVVVGSDQHDVGVVLRDTTAQAQVGLAIYERDDITPDGVAEGNSVGDGTAVFRQRIGASSLQAGAWNIRPDQTVVRFRVKGPLPAWRLADDCAVTGVKKPSDVMLDETVDGKAFGGPGCGTFAQEDLDPGTNAGQPDHWPLGVGWHTIVVRLVDGSGAPAHVANASFGAAIYSVGGQQRVDGVPMDDQIEANGRDWLLDQKIPADNAQITGPAYVQAVIHSGAWQLVGQHLTAGDRDLVPQNIDIAPGVVGEPELGEVLAGSTYRFWLKHPKDSSAKATILVYRPAG
jgi:hypothetical protein